MAMYWKSNHEKHCRRVVAAREPKPYLLYRYFRNLICGLNWYSHFQRKIQLKHWILFFWLFLWVFQRRLGQKCVEIPKYVEDEVFIFRYHSWPICKKSKSMGKIQNMFCLGKLFSNLVYDHLYVWLKEVQNVMETVNFHFTKLFEYVRDTFGIPEWCKIIFYSQTSRNPSKIG